MNYCGNYSRGVEHVYKVGDTVSFVPSWCRSAKKAKHSLVFVMTYCRVFCVRFAAAHTRFQERPFRNVRKCDREKNAKNKRKQVMNWFSIYADISHHGDSEPPKRFSLNWCAKEKFNYQKFFFKSSSQSKLIIKMKLRNNKKIVIKFNSRRWFSWKLHDAKLLSSWT